MNKGKNQKLNSNNGSAPPLIATHLKKKPRKSVHSDASSSKPGSRQTTTSLDEIHQPPGTAQTNVIENPYKHTIESLKRREVAENIQFEEQGRI